jgi:hypothetical protein
MAAHFLATAESELSDEFTEKDGNGAERKKRLMLPKISIIL